MESKAKTMGRSFYADATWKAVGQVLGGDEGKKKMQGKWREAQSPGEEPDTWLTIKWSQKLKYMV